MNRLKETFHASGKIVYLDEAEREDRNFTVRILDVRTFENEGATYHVHWITRVGDVLYHIHTWGDDNHSTLIQQDAQKIAAGFQIIDPRGIPAPSKSAAPSKPAPAPASSQPATPDRPPSSTPPAKPASPGASSSFGSSNSLELRAAATPAPFTPPDPLALPPLATPVPNSIPPVATPAPLGMPAR
jgi:hypothetical protein